MTTFDTPFQKWVAEKEPLSRYAGISVMRIKKELDNAFRVIHPQNIETLREEADND